MESNIAFAGRFGSGKTTLARATAKKLRIGYAGFGATLKRVAGERGISVTRDNLQALGEELVRDTPEELCRRVISDREPSNSAQLAIDGLRHAKVYEILRQMSATKQLVCVFVTLPDEIRIQRIKAREELTDAQIQEMDSHSTEIQVNTAIRALADITVDNSKSVQSVVADIVSSLSRFP